MENPIDMNDLGESQFYETSIIGYIGFYLDMWYVLLWNPMVQILIPLRDFLRFFACDMLFVA